MDRDEALAELAPALAVALRLHDAGAGEELIAVALGIDADAVPTLVVVAEAKLTSVLASGPRHAGR